MDDQAKAAFAHINDRLTTIKADLAGDIDALANADQRGRIEERRRDREAALKAKAVAARTIAKLGGMQDQLGAIENALAEGDPEKAQSLVKAASKFVTASLAEDPDVDGADNPVVREEDQ